MKIGLALAGVTFAIVAFVFAVGNLGIAFRFLTDRDGQTSEARGLRMLITLVTSVGLSGLATRLSFACFGAWQRRSNSELTKLF